MKDAYALIRLSAVIIRHRVGASRRPMTASSEPFWIDLLASKMTGP
jgi:hypothetical protein